LFGRRFDETNARAAECAGTAIGHDETVHGDGRLRAGQVESQKNRRPRQHRHVAGPTQGDPAGAEILGLAEMQTSLNRVANRAHDGDSPTFATISFRPAALKVHTIMVRNPCAYRKFLYLGLVEGQCVFDDEVGNLIDHRVGQTAGET